jgi:hypothetical protein
MQSKSFVFPSVLTARQDVPDRFSGSVETFARRTGSGSGHHGESTKHRTLLDSLLAPKMVREVLNLF